MNLHDISGVATIIFGAIFTFAGIGAQVLKNKKEKRCGNPLLLPILAIPIQASRSIHAATLGSWYIIVIDLIGAILCSIMIYQFFKYRKQKLGQYS